MNSNLLVTHGAAPPQRVTSLPNCKSGSSAANFGDLLSKAAEPEAASADSPSGDDEQLPSSRAPKKTPQEQTCATALPLNALTAPPEPASEPLPALPQGGSEACDSPKSPEPQVGLSQGAKTDIAQGAQHSLTQGTSTRETQTEACPAISKHSAETETAADVQCAQPTTTQELEANSDALEPSNPLAMPKSQREVLPPQTGSGITGAQIITEMPGLKQNAVLEATEQQNLPAAEAQAVQLLPRARHSAPTPSAYSALDHSQPLHPPPPISIEAAATLAPESPAARVDRLEQLIADVAVQVRQADSQRISVVIRPDASSELLLELRVRDNGIEARAELTGSTMLKEQWSELQSRLAGQGIQLGDLGHSNSFARGQSGGQQGQSSEWSANEPWPLTTIDERSSQNQSERAVVSASRARWEVWA